MLVVLERSSGTQLIFLKRLDLQPTAEDDKKGVEDDEKGTEDDEKGTEDDDSLLDHLIVEFWITTLTS